MLLRTLIKVCVFSLALPLSFPFSGTSMAIDKRPMQIDDLFRFVRIADPQLSPSASQIVYQATEIVDASKNAKKTQLWLCDVDGSNSRQITYSGKSDSHPRWSPDGTRILFESNRDGTSQLYVMDLKSGGEPIKLTNIATGASGGIWSPDGKRVAFYSAVNPKWSDLSFADSNAKNKAEEETAANNPVKAKTFTKLFYRHWDSYVEDKRNHLFIIHIDGTECRDITPGDRDAYPTSTTFSVGDDFNFSPDGQFVLFTAVPKNGESWSTNHDICRVSINNKSEDWPSLTSQNLAADSYPKFSPDGKFVAFRTQARPGYEADKWNLVLQACSPDGSFSGSPTVLTSQLDRSVNDFAWQDSVELVFSTEEAGSSALYRVSKANPPALMKIGMPDDRLGQITGLSTQRGKLVLARSNMNEPANLFSMALDKLSSVKTVTTHNKALLDSLDRTAPESLKVDVEGPTEMQMWILKPPGFDAKKKWPVVYLIHGGPQGAWEDGWSFRWNAQLWAAQGYVVALPNPRGSTGFGQKFCDEISGDWGGKCYRDLIAGLKRVQALEYVDKKRIASAGASFGGYMQDWFAVNEIAKEFQCFITHCSVYNFESMWGTTDELWFDEYEHGGLPWELPGKYREFSPHTLAANLGKFKVPMLVVHNDLDFRCPIGQGHELFQALQRQGVKSRFVNFPDEGHWVSKPANSIHWHKEVFSWLGTYCKSGGE
ncbi:MAG: S9 family peptidase [Planctomycetota bacterium]|nr:S9 family peptidase [Planctomycetota bacterium]